MRVGILSRTALVVLLTASLQAGELVRTGPPRFERFTGAKRFHDAIRVVSLDNDDENLPVSRAEIDLYRKLFLERKGDGAGGDVANLVVIQTNFASEATNCPVLDGKGVPQNVVLMLWDEPTQASTSVDVLIDEVPVLTIPFDDPMDGRPFLDGPNGGICDGDPRNCGFFLVGVPEGEHVFAVEEGDLGTRSERELEILNDPPIADAANVTLEEGPDNPADGTCSMFIRWENVCPVPDNYFILLNGEALGGPFVFDLPGSESWIFITGAPADTWSAEILGFKAESEDNPDAMYRTCFPSTDGGTTLTCDPAPCHVAPIITQAVQVEYNNDEEGKPVEGGPAVFLEYLVENPIFPEGIDILADGVVLGTIPGDVFAPEDPLGFYLFHDTLGFVDDIGGPTPVTIALQGICDAAMGDTTDPRERPFEVLPDSPHTTPIEGNVCCSWDPADTGSTTGEWMNASCSSRIFVHTVPEANVDDEGNVDDGLLLAQLMEFEPPGVAENPATVVGSAETATVLDTAETDFLVLQYTTWANGSEYASPPVTCIQDPNCNDVAMDFFIPAICSANPNGGPNPQLTDGIFVLNHLFRANSPAPACKAACDANGNGGLELTDGVHIFRFLFVSGALPPAGWVGVTPTCVPITKEMLDPDSPVSCLNPNSNCMMEGPIR